MPKRIATLLTHLAVWLAIVSLPVLILPRPGNHPPPGGESNWERSLFFITFNLALIGFYYLNANVLMPRLLIRARRRAYFSAIALSFLGFLCIIQVLQWLLPDPGRPAQDLPLSFMPVVLFCLVWGASSGIRFNSEWRKSEERRRASETERLNAEMAQLKSQINPHFLFNTLNGIYTLTITKADSASDAVLQLAGLMRYVLTDACADFVPLEKDLEHLRHFINLHRLRLTTKTTVGYQYEGESATNRRIAPLLLLPFVENAFKYGASTNEEAPIDISLALHDGLLHFNCRNRILRTQTDEAEQTGTGISNVQRRLDLIYPGKYQLEITTVDNLFQVDLQVDLRP